MVTASVALVLDGQRVVPARALDLLADARTEIRQRLGVISSRPVEVLLFTGGDTSPWATDFMPVVGALHIVFGLVACFFGLRFLGAGFAHFSATGRGAPNFWNLIFLLVALQMTTALRPLIGTAAAAKGFRTLADDGVRLVRTGATSLDELMRVVDLTDRM